MGDERRDDLKLGGKADGANFDRSEVGDDGVPDNASDLGGSLQNVPRGEGLGSWIWPGTFPGADGASRYAATEPRCESYLPFMVPIDTKGR